MRISDWSSDVCSSDLFGLSAQREFRRLADDVDEAGGRVAPEQRALGAAQHLHPLDLAQFVEAGPGAGAINAIDEHRDRAFQRSEERTVGTEWVSTCRSRWLPYT